VLHLCDDPLHSQQSNPTRQIFDRPGNRSNPSDGQPGREVFPYVVTTYRLTEHHTAGGMSRGLPYLAELQPEFFCEVSPELARERGLEQGGWATIVSVRTAIEARVLVTSRMPALRLGDRVVHQIGLPYHRTSRRARRRPAISGRAEGLAGRPCSSWSSPTGPGPAPEPRTLASRPTHDRQSWPPRRSRHRRHRPPDPVHESLLDCQVWRVQAGTVVSPRAVRKGGAQAGNRRDLDRLAVPPAVAR
jgi:Molydopterin dinucleotide binding domain